jgi:hypothetical protein
MPWKGFYKGKLSKPELEKALRAHKAASGEMNSKEHERCDAYRKAEAEAKYVGYYIYMVL